MPSSVPDVSLAMMRKDVHGVCQSLNALLGGNLQGWIAAGKLKVLFNLEPQPLTSLSGIPTIFQDREFAAAGGLISYGGSNSDAYRLLAAYVGRILRGEKPADLPVQQTTKVELVVNLKTAKALGLTVPLIMQMTADEVIE